MLILMPRGTTAPPCVCLALLKSGGLYREKRVRHRRRIVTQAVQAEIAKEPLARLEYVNLCDSVTLEEIEEIHDSALLALAVWIGKTRLIDNSCCSDREEGGVAEEVAD